MKNMLLNKNKKVASEYIADSTSGGNPLIRVASSGSKRLSTKVNSKDYSQQTSSKHSNLTKKTFGMGRNN